MWFLNGLYSVFFCDVLISSTLVYTASSFYVRKEIVEPVETQQLVVSQRVLLCILMLAL